MDKESFEQLVAHALGNLPEEIQRWMDNVAVVVQFSPTADQLRRAGIRQGSILLGLYEGVPQTARTSYYGLVLPDKITIFQESIERVCYTEREIASQVQHTVVHELAHHFGISDDRLRDLGVY
ncbi:MAG: metallopeptidase family protein [Chloroflexi bacterium]|nr:metallopeptidase family protein [Chloroflexota bacterium]